MTLIYLGSLLDPSIEHYKDSFLDHSEFGFKVFIKYKNGVLSYLHNCTEVHNLYESDRIAFESDLLLTGGVRFIHTLDLVIVDKDDSLKEDFEEVLSLKI